MVKAIVFDMDGVLFDTERLCINSWQKVADKYHLGDISAPCIASIGVSREKGKEIFKATVSKDFPYEKMRNEVSSLCHKEIAENGLPKKSGVNEILTFCKEKGFKIGLATSTRRQTVISHLERAKILSFFDEIVCGDEIENSKPSPEIYIKACKKLSVEPQEALAVEDSYNGVISSTTAGMRCIMVPDVLVPNEEMEKLAFKILDSLSSVIELLKNENL